MYSSLLDAPIHADLEFIEITNPDLAIWLERLGLFIGDHIIRHDEEINYHPVRVRGSKGDVIVPAGLGMKVLVHVESNGERKPLVEMKRDEDGHIEAVSCGKGCNKAMEHLGIEEGVDVTFIRSLPHMDYITIVEGKRTRLTEGEAARLWGTSGEGEEMQFYFAPQGKPFSIKEIIGGRKVTEHLRTHGITAGSTVVLESIHQAQSLHKPGVEPITITSTGGLRLHLSPEQASKIIVMSISRDDNVHPGNSTK